MLNLEVTRLANLLVRLRGYVCQFLSGRGKTLELLIRISGFCLTGSLWTVSNARPGEGKVTKLTKELRTDV